MTPADLAATHAAAFTRSRPWSAAEFAGLLTQRRCHVIGDADCFALFTLIADETELLTIATHPKAQRQGLAHARLVDWQRLAIADGATRAFLDVAADNAPALALYRASGFRQTGCRPGYYRRSDGESEGDSVDALLMSRDLVSG